MKLKGKFSRRSAIRSIGSIGAVCALENTLSPRRTEAAENVTALAVVGDRWHAFDYIRTAMTRTFVKEAGLSIDFTSNTDLISTNNLKKYKLLIMLMDGMVFTNGYNSPFHLIPRDLKLVSDPPVEGIDPKHDMWIEHKEGKPDQGEIIKEFVQNGGGALFYHNTHYNSTANDNFRDVCGALFVGHTQFRPFRMEITNRDHPIAQGVNDFTITEEQHFLIYDKEPDHVFMRSSDLDNKEYNNRKYGNMGTTCKAGWAYDYGKGRVCFMTPGHTIPTMWNPEYVKLQKNAVKWVLREL